MTGSKVEMTLPHHPLKSTGDFLVLGIFWIFRRPLPPPIWTVSQVSLLFSLESFPKLNDKDLLLIRIVEENHKIVMCLLEIISLKGYTPVTWRAASKKRRFHKRLNKVFLIIEKRLGNILEEEEPTEFDSESNVDEYEQIKSWRVLTSLVWQTAVQGAMVW